MDYTLKFPTELAANVVLFTQADDTLTSNFPSHAIDVIGPVYRPTGKMLDGDYPEMAAVGGWHVNVRGPEDATLAQHHITVNNPVRGWA
jgi:hypothetical protein